MWAHEVTAENVELELRQKIIGHSITGRLVPRLVLLHILYRSIRN